MQACEQMKVSCSATGSRQWPVLPSLAHWPLTSCCSGVLHELPDTLWIQGASGFSCGCHDVVSKLLIWIGWRCNGITTVLCSSICSWWAVRRWAAERWAAVLWLQASVSRWLDLLLLACLLLNGRHSRLLLSTQLVHIL